MDDEYAHLFPIALEVEQGKKYTWCGCGKSQTQPLCDKADCGDQCFSFVAELTDEVMFCDCKETKNPPWCDGSHAKLLIEALKKKRNV